MSKFCPSTTSKFQSLIGILADFNVKTEKAIIDVVVFQSLIGILADFNEDNEIKYLPNRVSIPHRDFSRFQLFNI